jgi:fused signal recognition particle receptor
VAWLGEKLRVGLAKTRKGFLSRLESILPGGRKVDGALLEDLEDVLLGADVGLSTAEEIIDRVRQSAKGSLTGEELRGILRTELLAVLSSSRGGPQGAGYPQSQADDPAAGLAVDSSGEGSSHDPLRPQSEPSEKPQVILVVGVNGAGKTTTVGKLAWRLINQGKKVMVAASDTFRAGATEQLDQWVRRSGGEIVRQQRGADPAAVAFDALQAAKARGCDYLLVDTAGRLHTKANLMEELKKIGRVLARLSPGAPHRVLLVLDATAGQNALIQAREFGEATGVTGIVMAKLDGTARGGAVIAVARELNVPVEMLGVGEAPEDLTDFDPEEFVDALIAP